MIGDFIQINAFMEAVTEIKSTCCRDDKHGSGKILLRNIWNEFLNALKTGVLEQGSQDKLSVFIKIVQNNLTDFSNKIYNLYNEFHSCSDNCNFQINELLSEIAIEVVDTLESLQINYADHFNFSASPPLWLIFKNQQFIPIQKKINQALEESQIDYELIRIIDGHIASLYVLSSSNITSWRQFIYMKDLVGVINSFIELPSAESNTNKLIRILVGLDFNTLAFYEYILSYISNIAREDIPYEEQEMELLLLLKMFESIRLEVKTGYKEEVLSIKESICHHILNELDRISKMKAVIMSYPINVTNSKNSFFYFDVSSTIEELFFLLRVMIDVHFIKTKFKANLYSFVSRHIKTTRTKNPSPQYMRNLFGPDREVPLRVVRQVRHWLSIMITYIDKNFGDKTKIWFFISFANLLFMEIGVS